MNSVQVMWSAQAASSAPSSTCRSTAPAARDPPGGAGPHRDRDPAVVGHASPLPDRCDGRGTYCPLCLPSGGTRRSVSRRRVAGARLRPMPELRSRTSTHGRTMAGARALWRATGMTDDDFGKPIVAIANSFTQFVPGHVHLNDLGQLAAGSIFEAGGIGPEVNTIAVDDGIAIGHGGMLYSPPSPALIAGALADI